MPRRLDVHIIMDNYSTHKTALIRNWFAKRPRFHVHYTPTYGSWLSLVERWFAGLTMKQIRRGAYRSVAQLRAGIQQFVDAHHHDPKPFVWTKSPNENPGEHRSIRPADRRRAGLATNVTNHGYGTLAESSLTVRRSRWAREYSLSILDAQVTGDQIGQQSAAQFGQRFGLALVFNKSLINLPQVSVKRMHRLCGWNDNGDWSEARLADPKESRAIRPAHDLFLCDAGPKQ